MASFFHIYIVPKPGTTQQQVEEVMNKGRDWYRYATGLYIAYSTVDADKWMARLRPLVEPNGSLLIWRLHPTESNGWMTEDLWEWIRKDGRMQEAK